MRSFCSATLLLLANLGLLQAQTPDAATIRGQILDQNRVPISEAQVRVTDKVTLQERTSQTDAAGRFWFAGLPVGDVYRIKATKQSFADTESQDLTLSGGTAADVTMQMNVAGQSTQVTVIGIAGEVRADQPQIGNRLGKTELDETPLLNRRVTYLPLLNAANRPAINQGDVFMNENLFTTNGAGRRQTWFEVDGTNGNDAWGRQTLMTNVPLASVGEVDILVNDFSAEFGGSTGSAVNIITKSGGNDFHGQVLGLWRPSQVGAKLSGFTSTNAASGNDVTSDLLGQGGLSLSGPLGTAKHTQFFAAGEFSGENRASPIISPVAPGSFVGHYRGWLGSFRLDHQFNNSQNLFFRSNVDGFYDTNPNGTVGGNNLANVDRIFRRRTYSEALGETATFSPRAVNSFRLQFQLASPITEFDPVIYGTQFSVPISAGGTFTSGTSQSALLINRQYEASDTLSLILGRHQLKFGGDFIYARSGGNSKEFGGPIYLGSFAYKTCTLGLAFCESPAYLNNINNVQTYTQSYGNANYTVTDRIWSLFVQDDYHVRPDLTINLGLRYEQQSFTDSNLNFAPRAGFAYNVGGNGKTVLRGGFGIYLSQIVDNSQANYALTGPTGVFNYSASAGQVGFPTSVAAAPLPAFPTGATAPLRSLYVRPGNSGYLNQFFPTSVLPAYPSQLLNPYSEQWTFGIQQSLKSNWVLSLDYVGSHTIRINRPLDIDAPAPFVRNAPNQTRTAQAANCTRPYWIWWYQQRNLLCTTSGANAPPYSVIQTDVNNGYAYYQALDVNLSHHFGKRFEMLVSYTWSHAIDNVDPDIPSQNPNDANYTGRVENGSAIFDQRHRFVWSGVYTLPYHINVGGVTTLGSGLPYNIVTGTTNSGDTGATTDRPAINGVVVGRNTGRGRPIYDLSPFVEVPVPLGFERAHLLLRAEAFNVLNHANFVGYSGTWGNANTPGAGFGTPLVGVTNQLPARSFQFSARVDF